MHNRERFACFVFILLTYCLLDRMFLILKIFLFGLLVKFVIAFVFFRYFYGAELIRKLMRKAWVQRIAEHHFVRVLWRIPPIRWVSRLSLVVLRWVSSNKM